MHTISAIWRVGIASHSWFTWCSPVIFGVVLITEETILWNTELFGTSYHNHKSCCVLLKFLLSSSLTLSNLNRNRTGRTAFSFFGCTKLSPFFSLEVFAPSPPISHPTTATKMVVLEALSPTVTARFGSSWRKHVVFASDHKRTQFPRNFA